MDKPIEVVITRATRLCDAPFYCTLCDRDVGSASYHYDNNTKGVHYTAMCKSCIESLKDHISSKNYKIIEKETISKNCTDGQYIVREKAFGIRCAKCSRSMNDYLYHYEYCTDNFCNTCLQDELYKIRKSNKGILFYFKDKESKYETPDQAVEENNLFFVVCSKCYAHTYSYISYSRWGKRGLCKYCAGLG